jgi:hypothetical protein
MDIHQQIAELAAELAATRLTKNERASVVRQLHELQRQLEIDEAVALENGDAVTADALYERWIRIENALAA